MTIVTKHADDLPAAHDSLGCHCYMNIGAMHVAEFWHTCYFQIADKTCNKKHDHAENDTDYFKEFFHRMMVMMNEKNFRSYSGADS